MLHPLARESLLEKQGIAEADVRVSAVVALCGSLQSDSDSQQKGWRLESTFGAVKMSWQTAQDNFVFQILQESFHFIHYEGK